MTWINHVVALVVVCYAVESNIFILILLIFLLFSTHLFFYILLFITGTCTAQKSIVNMSFLIFLHETFYFYIRMYTNFFIFSCWNDFQFIFPVKQNKKYNIICREKVSILRDMSYCTMYTHMFGKKKWKPFIHLFFLLY